MTWIPGETRTLYECPWFRLEVGDVTLPDGRLVSHHALRVPTPAVGVLAVDDGDRVLLLRRHRFITGTWGWEIPAGAADPGEDPAAAAARELLEETGVRCAALEPLGEAELSAGLMDKRALLYRGSGPVGGGTITSPEESVERRWFTAAEQDRLLDGDEVRDVLTQVALLRHARRYRLDLDRS